MLVVLFNIAEASNDIDGAAWDIAQAAVDKASGDEARGVKGVDKSSNLNYNRYNKTSYLISGRTERWQPERL